VITLAILSSALPRQDEWCELMVARIQMDLLAYPKARRPLDTHTKQWRDVILAFEKQRNTST